MCIHIHVHVHDVCMTCVWGVICVICVICVYLYELNICTYIHIGYTREGYITYLNSFDVSPHHDIYVDM